MSQISISKKDFLWSYLGTFFRVCTNILLLPIIIYYLPADELGLWYVFASISQLVVLLDFGFAPTFARNIAYVWCGAKNLKKQSIDTIGANSTDWREFKTIVETCKLIYFAIAVISSLLLFTAGSAYVVKVSSQSYLLEWFIYAIAVAINILYGYYTSLLRGVGAIAENNIAGTISKIVQLIFSVIFLILGYGLQGLSVAYLLSGLTLRVISRMLFNNYENIRKRIKDVNIENKIKLAFERLKIIWYNASRDGMVTLSSFFISQANTLVCSYAISLATTGSYGLSIQVATLIASIACIPFSTYQAKMQEMAVLGNKEKNRVILSTCMVEYVISFVGLSILAYLCVPIIKMIKPEMEFSSVMLLGVLAQFFIINYYSLFASFISAYNTLPYVRAFILSSILSFLLSTVLVFITDLEVWALVVSPIIASFYNLWRWPHFVRRELIKISVYDFYRLGYKETIMQVKEILGK